jgi:hypothetical protein
VPSDNNSIVSTPPGAVLAKAVQIPSAAARPDSQTAETASIAEINVFILIADFTNQV